MQEEELHLQPGEQETAAVAVTVLPRRCSNGTNAICVTLVTLFLYLKETTGLLFFPYFFNRRPISQVEGLKLPIELGLLLKTAPVLS